MYVLSLFCSDSAVESQVARNIDRKRGEIKMKKLATILALAGLVFAGFAGSAQAILIDFESDTVGGKANGWTSVDSPLVHFTDSNGAGLLLANFGAQSFGQALATADDFDDSWLIMDFDVPVLELSLWFGNDDPAFSSAGDEAVLTAFLGAVQVGQTSVVMNRDDLMNQSIGISGVTFDSATFYYDVVPQQGLVEIVDDIDFTLIPEPTTMLMLGGLGAGLAGARKLRRKK